MLNTMMSKNKNPFSERGWDRKVHASGLPFHTGVEAKASKAKINTWGPPGVGVLPNVHTRIS